MAEQSVQNSAKQPTTKEIAASKISGIPLPEAQPQGEQVSEPVEVQAEPQAEQTLEGQQPPEEEMEDFEFADFKIPLPKSRAQKLKEGLLRQEDYTRKTQELAEARRGLSQKEQLITAQAQFQQHAIEDIAQIKGLEAQIRQYDQLNWGGMDTDTLVRTKHARDQLADLKRQAEESLNVKARNFQQARSEAMQNMLKSGMDQLRRNIEGFSEKTIGEIRQYAMNEGYSEAELDQIVDPRQVATLYKAMQLDKLRQSKPGLQNRANQAPPVVKPGAASKPQGKGELEKNKFANAKTPREREFWGTKILAQKMRI